MPLSCQKQLLHCIKRAIVALDLLSAADGYQGAQERLGAYLHVMEQFGISDINTFIKESEDDYAKVEIGCAQLLQEGDNSDYCLRWRNILLYKTRLHSNGEDPWEKY